MTTKQQRYDGGGDPWLQRMNEAREQGEYADWYNALHSFTAMIFDLPVGAVVRVPMEHEVMEEALLCMELGMLQFLAEVNNSSYEIGRRRKEQSLRQQAIDIYKDDPDEGYTPPAIYDLEEDEWEYHEIYSALPLLRSEDDVTDSQGIIDQLETEIRAIQQRDRVNTQKGIHRDYSRLRRIYSMQDRERRWNGLKYTEAPSFLQELYNLVVVHYAGSQDEHESDLLNRGAGGGRERVVEVEREPQPAARTGPRRQAEGQEYDF